MVSLLSSGTTRPLRATIVDCSRGLRSSEIRIPDSRVSGGLILSTYTTSPEKPRLNIFSFSPAVARERIRW